MKPRLHRCGKETICVRAVAVMNLESLCLKDCSATLHYSIRLRLQLRHIGRGPGGGHPSSQEGN